jgi:hypothetical protein
VVFKKIFKNFHAQIGMESILRATIQGVFVRFSDPDNNPNNAGREGYEIQIDDKADDSLHQTGAIYDFAAPSKIEGNLNIIS